LFLPGDAFFPTEITAEVLTRLEEGDESPPVFEYSAFGGYEGAFCGYAGYNRARIPQVDEGFVANLRNAYDHIREYEERQLVERNLEGKTVLVETNGVRVLFYPDTFEFPRFEIGLRYNENWVEEAVKFGHSPEAIRLCCLVDDKDAVMLSWRDSTKVEPLLVSLPNVPLRPVPVMEDPVSVNGRIKAIVLNSIPLKEYFRPDQFSYLEVLIVDSMSVRRLEYSDGKWTDVETNE
jgi:hypothetical protein